MVLVESFGSVPVVARRARMKIVVALEVLPDQGRADDGAVLLDQAAVRLTRKRDLRNAGHRERIDEAGQRAEEQEQTQRRGECVGAWLHP